MKKSIFDALYFISLGVWVTSCFITIFYGNNTPMWVSLVFMTLFNGLRLSC